MPRKLKSKPKSLPSRRARNYGLKTGKYLDLFSTDCKSGAGLARSGKDTTELTLPVELEIDLEATEIRLRGFAGGKIVDQGIFDGQAYDGDEVKPTVCAPVFGSEEREELGGEPLGLRSYESSAFSAREAFRDLDDEVFGSDVGPDQVPVVALTGFEKISYSGRSSMKPVWKVKGFRPRREEFRKYAADRSIGVTSDDADPDDDISTVEV